MTTILTTSLTDFKGLLENVYHEQSLGSLQIQLKTGTIALFFFKGLQNNLLVKKLDHVNWSILDMRESGATVQEVIDTLNLFAKDSHSKLDQLAEAPDRSIQFLILK